MPVNVLQASTGELPDAAGRTIGAYLDSARLLGRRTAELHVALASDPDDPSFAPERVSPQDQRSIYQSLNALAARSLELLRSQLNRLPEDAKDEAKRGLDLEPRITQ